MKESEISLCGWLQTGDAETQMDQWTPLMDTIKKEAGEAVLAHMEERLATALSLALSEISQPLKIYRRVLLYKICSIYVTIAV